uniref:Uncharacterized protein n=2 Tax=Bursaphelenchus xylophilus TaxID=6326 RepID=A0A1I7SJV9_BURXY
MTVHNKGKSNINLVESDARTMVPQYTEKFKEELEQSTCSIQKWEDATQIPTFNSGEETCYTDSSNYRQRSGYQCNR